MRFLILIFTTTFATALPDREEARRRLGSENFEERQSLTMAFWEAGKTAIPLLKKLASDSDPEVAGRANFVLKRLTMGLGPDAPDNLLHLATRAEQARFEARSGRIGDLLEHPGGFSVALFFIDRWISDQTSPHDHRLSLTEAFVDSLLEQRKDWHEFLTAPLSPLSRAYFIATLSIQETPIKDQMITNLAARELRGIHQSLVKNFELLPEETHLTLARLAVIQKNLALATKILSHGLTHSESPDLARALAFLEQSADLPPTSCNGPWQREIELFRARARQDHPETSRLAASITTNAVLSYESRLLAGDLTLPPRKDAALLAGVECLPAWHLAFGLSPEEPDIEALTSSVLIDWPPLVRTLTALGHPLEAAERLTSENQIASALGLLWRTGHRDEALALARQTLGGNDEKLRITTRLTMASLYLKNGDQKDASKYFEPLIEDGLQSMAIRRRAIPLAIRIYPFDKAASIQRTLRSGRPYERKVAVAPFLKVPPLVAGYWYEHFYDPKAGKSPAEVIKEVRKFLTDQLPRARQIISREIDESKTNPLLPTDPLYQNALFLRIPGALAMVEKAAWYRLETTDLLQIIRSEEWPLDSRLKALDSALAISPADPVLRWYDLELNNKGDLGTLNLALLADPNLALRLASLTQERETLAITARVARFGDPSTLRCLGFVGRSHLQTDDPTKASRLLLAKLLAEVVIGTQSGSSIKGTLDDLNDLFQARLQMATIEGEKTIWRTRIKGLGRTPLPAK